MQRNYVFGQQGFGAAKPQGNQFAQQHQPGRVYAGGSPNFNERTGQYQPPQQNQGGFQAYQPPAQRAAPQQGGFQSYRPGQAQPVNRSQGSPYSPPDVPGGGSMNERMPYPSMPYPQVPGGYSPPDVPGGGSMNERMPYPSMPYPQVPGGRMPQPRPVPGYGGGYDPGGARTADFRDRDGDGVDDRNQSGPSMPYPQVPGGYGPSQQSYGLPGRPQVVGGKLNRSRPSQQPPVMPRRPRWKGSMPIIQGRELPPQYQAPQQFQSPHQPQGPSWPSYGGQLPPSSFTAQSFGPMGGMATPQQNMAQRDAFIARLNAERAPLAATAGVYQTGMAPVAPPLNRDFASMWGQAGNMVANGWTNPLAGLFG